MAREARIQVLILLFFGSWSVTIWIAILDGSGQAPFLDQLRNQWNFVNIDSRQEFKYCFLFLILISVHVNCYFRLIRPGANLLPWLRTTHHGQGSKDSSIVSWSVSIIRRIRPDAILLPCPTPRNRSWPGEQGFKYFFGSWSVSIWIAILDWSGQAPFCCLDQLRVIHHGQGSKESYKLRSLYFWILISVHMNCYIRWISCTAVHHIS